MALMFTLTLALLAAVAAVMLTAVRGGATELGDSAGDLADRIHEKRRHIAEATCARPPHLR